MKIKQPTPRYWTSEAIQQLADTLGLPNTPNMQDWPYEVARAEDIQVYLDLYDRLEEEDQKFVLMDMIIQATEEQPTDALLASYWQEVKKRLEQDFAIHEYSIHYWCNFAEGDDLVDNWRVAAFMREVWMKEKK